MLRLPHFLHNRLTDGGEVVSLARRPSFTPRNIPGINKIIIVNIRRTMVSVKYDSEKF
jgi:hypothetical protein